MHPTACAPVSKPGTGVSFEVTTVEREIKEKMQLSEKEEKLIRLIRDLKFGELRLFVADSQPVRLEEVKKSIKL